MNISNSQVNRLRHFVRAGLRSLFRPEPQTAVEWADANYYLPKESAYQEGRWETLPFQRAIMNAMGSDYVREVNVVKSARVGYSKMLLGVYAYFIEHKQRNTLIWLPTDGDAENFMKTHVEPTIRDIPSLLALAPWYGKKHRDNTLTMKRFSNGRGFWCLGGKAAKNYREKSVDVAGYDELAAFDEDIEQEGSPTFLGDKRIEGSVWPKSIRGSTPKVRGTCQIERAASESPHFMRFHVACPHCGEEQYLKFGDKETPFGLKWTPDDPSNAIQLHQDHIVGSFFRLSHRPSWRYLGIGEEDARAFSREVEAAWKEFAEDDCCCIDVERKRTFTMMIREGVAMHAFNGELFVQATWDTSPSRLFRTQFRMVSPKRISNPNNTGDSWNCRAGVQINDSGAALGYYVSEDGYPGWMPQKWTWIPRELPGGRASFIHVFEPVEDGQTRGANVFYSVMEQMKMLDTLQNTQLQSAIVKAMYAATIESELDTQSAMDFILGANSQEQRERLTGWIGEIAAYYAAAPVRLGGAKVPHLMPGDSLNLQTAQDTDNGYSVFEQSLLRYIAAGLGVSYEQLSRNYAQMSYSTARASANESWAYFMGRRKFVASRQASQMFLCWLEEAIVRRVVTLPSKARFSFQEARSAWGNCDWIGSGRMAIDGLKEVQEAVMLIEAGLSTYEKECAKRGDDYQEIFAQQVRETMERRAAGLKPPAWAAAAFESGLRQSTEEEKSDSRAA